MTKLGMTVLVETITNITSRLGDVGRDGLSQGSDLGVRAFTKALLTNPCMYDICKGYKGKAPKALTEYVRRVMDNLGWSIVEKNAIDQVAALLSNPNLYELCIQQMGLDRSERVKKEGYE